ncbi:MAG: peptidylprolyl isomerase [Planctomycetes bacterium]|nr:peptidylprolyl isomerase [Planctomycetota bacterium]
MSRGNQKRKTKGSAGLNKKNAADFLDKNRHKPGVIETDSGLQYVVVDSAEGPGRHPAVEDTVVVQQRISLLDGTLIEDTYKKPDPATFPMQEAIEGYQEGLSLMKTGDRFKFFIPSDLAWGKRGAGQKIGPYATLVIDSRLLEVL